MEATARSGRRPRIVVSLDESEIADFVSMLSNEALGIAIRVIDAQMRNGRGLPDGRNTHQLLGLPKGRWTVLREELLLVMRSEDGFFVYPPLRERLACRTAARAGARREAMESPAIPAIALRDDAGPATPKPVSPKTLPPKTVSPAADPSGTDGSVLVSAKPKSTDPKTAARPKAVPAEPGHGPRADRDTRGGAAGAPTPSNTPTPSSAPTPVGPAIARKRGRQPHLPFAHLTPQAQSGALDEIPSPFKMTIDSGILLLMRTGTRNEQTARACIVSLLKEWDEGFVAAAIADAIKRRNEIVDPFSWMKRFLTDRYPKKAEKLVAEKTAKGRKAQKQLPVATPDFMGISKAMQERLRRNAALPDDAGFAPRAAMADDKTFKALDG